MKSKDGISEYKCECHCKEHYYFKDCQFSLVEVITAGIVSLIILFCCWWMFFCTGEKRRKKPRKKSSQYLRLNESDGEPSMSGWRVAIATASLSGDGLSSSGQHLRSINRPALSSDFDLVPWNTKSQASTGILSEHALENPTSNLKPDDLQPVSSANDLRNV